MMEKGGKLQRSGKQVHRGRGQRGRSEALRAGHQDRLRVVERRASQGPAGLAEA